MSAAGGGGPVPVDAVARASATYDAVQMAGGAVFWVEGRPEQGGRDVLVRWSPQGGARDVLPAGTGVASGVHEYGGGAYLAFRHGLVVWCDADDQRLYRLLPGGRPCPLTDLGMDPDTAPRHADLAVTPDGGLLICVRERHDQGAVINELIVVPTDGSAPPRILASGWDFYAAPRVSPDGRWLAWLTWRHPLMPWDGTWLWLAPLATDGTLGPAKHIAGGPGESMFAPSWSPRGDLCFVSDRTGWWNLYTWRKNRVEPVLQRDAELGVAQWEFGYSTYDFLSEDRIAVLVQEGPRERITVLDRRHDNLREIDTPYTSIKPYLAAGANHIAFIGSSPTRTPTVATIDFTTGTVRELASSDQLVDPASIIWPRPMTYPTHDGRSAHLLLYLPTSAGAGSQRHDLPALIVRPHPGPTTNTHLRLDPHAQFLASRGFAVADIDYRGSTGYGRAFRTALNGRWGTLDATDCADAATHLANLGHIDPNRVAIRGASAAGYTALRALAITDQFAAAVAISAIIDPAVWRSVAPKFQRHHADVLNGPLPEVTNRRHSLHTDPASITRPVLLLHGEHDTVTPAAQAYNLAAALGDTAQLHAFSDEGHTLRHADNIVHALHLELAFYNRIL